jgi:hypothetical protein
MKEKIKFVVGDLLNWYCQNVQVDIWYLKMFHKEMENSINESIHDFDKNKEWLPDDPNDPESSTHIYYKNMDAITFDLESIIKIDYPNLRRRSLLLVILSTVEKRLTSLSDSLRGKEDCKLYLRDIYTKKGKLIQINNYLVKVIQLKLTDEFVSDWEKLLIIQLIRNDIVHELGIYSTEKDNKRSKKTRIFTFIEYTSGITISDGNEYMLDEDFLNYTILLIDRIFINLEKSIREKYNYKYKLN